MDSFNFEGSSIGCGHGLGVCIGHENLLEEEALAPPIPSPLTIEDKKWLVSKAVPCTVSHGIMRIQIMCISFAVDWWYVADMRGAEGWAPASFLRPLDTETPPTPKPRSDSAGQSSVVGKCSL